jgi:CRISPR-associated endonuclease/helicase Cas3
MTFDRTFEELTGHASFPWQKRLYEEFVNGRIPPSCNLPTGLGKTSVVAIWLIALAHGQGKLPRRLVYVVNRRTVVDQTTAEAEKLRMNLLRKPELAELKERLQALCAGSYDVPLAISTLRGQFADNREWSADPARAAVICGTVDMIGSRLLFSGYGIGFKSRPLHAGFLGQDALLIHDEAHLEPAFQKLITAIEKEQQRERERSEELPWPKLRVVALSATARNGENNSGTDKPFELTSDEKSPPEELPNPPTEPIHHVWRRLKAKKSIVFYALEGDKEKVADRIGRLAHKYAEENSAGAILVFVNSLEDHAIVCNALRRETVQVLTGTHRGLERDRMADPRKQTGCPIFARFLKPPKPDASEEEKWKATPKPGTVFLVCTSAGEVGIDISADHMVCALSTFESMAQRLGRVNRFGDGDARIDVVHPASFGKVDKKTGELKTDEIDKRRQKTLELLRRLPALGEDADGNKQYDASPKAVNDLWQRTDLPCRIEDAFSPKPVMLDATDILFDAWALTTIRNQMPGRPPAGPYLHGIAEWQPPETYVAWREEVGVITGGLLEQYRPQEVLDNYPLKPHELLRDRSDRVLKQLVTIAGRHPDHPAWLLDDYGNVEVLSLRELADKDKKNRIDYRTVLLPPAVGGLQDGLLDGESPDAQDVADEWYEDAKKRIRRRVRVWDDDTQRDDKTAGMRLVREIRFEADDGDEDAPGQSWFWYERPGCADNEGSKSALKPIRWQDHTDKVETNAAAIVERLPLPDDAKRAVVLAAKFHDLGKKREVWQRSIGNPDPLDWHAKSGKGWKPRNISNYRHEFGSLLDIQDEREFREQSDDVKDLILHLVASGHGRGRPHFPPEEAFDPESKGRDVNKIAIEVVQRFARLQRKCGRWGLAYLESLLRAADWAASAEPSAYADEVEGKP